MTTKKSTLSLLLIFLFQLGFAQSPYQFRYSTEITIPSISLGLLIAGYVVDKKSEPLTPEDIMKLDISDINRMDRGVVENWNPKIAIASDVFMYATMASPLLHLAGENSRKDFLKTSVISLEVFALNTGLTYLTKTLVSRHRPYVYNPDVPMSEKLKSDSKHSFFSGHTSTTASMSYSFAFMYANYYPDSKAKPAVWAIAAGLPALTGYFRVKSGKHFWTDVLVGYAVGAFTGFIVPYLHEL
jgi:membrane-associated phospholipid phosphatase